MSQPPDEINPKTTSKPQLIRRNAISESDVENASEEVYSNNAVVDSGTQQKQQHQNEKKKLSFQTLDERNPNEIILFGLVSESRTSDLYTFLDWYSTSKINVNSRDWVGHDVLTKAVMGDDMEIFKELLAINPDKIQTRDALLTAAKLGKLDMIKEIFNFHEQRKEDWYSQEISTSGEYSYVITPLMLAAINEKFEVMELLYEKGERMPKLHLPNCDCSECKRSTRDVERTKHRIHLLEAMTNPVYMIFQAERDGDYDPVYESFMLMVKLKICKEEEVEYEKDYTRLLETAEKFTVGMIDMCRTLEETRILLSQKEGFEGSADHPYPRLGLAIDITHKKFASTTNVEFLMENDFAGHAWNPRSDIGRFVKAIVIILSLLLYPIMNVFMWLAMCCCSSGADIDFVKYLLSPETRCWSKLASYIYFCLMLMYLNCKDAAVGEIEYDVICIRWITILFVISHSVSLIRQFLISPVHFFQRGWNLFDFLTQLLFWSSFVVWFMEYQRHFNVIKKPYYKASEDPCTVGILLFSFASTMATMRILRWFILYPKLGPLQTAYGRMAANIWTILVFLVWTAVTFSIGTRIIYRPYLQLDKDGKKQPASLTDATVHFNAFFKMGKIGPNDASLFSPTVNQTSNETGGFEIVRHPQITTQFFITMIVIVYNIVALSFLRSSVTGLFGSTGKAVLKAKHIEWRSLRVQEWLYYLQDTTLAHPFNILPNWWCIKKWSSKIKMDIETSSQEKEMKEKYPYLLNALFKRYLRDKEREKLDGDKKKDGKEKKKND